jgi:hypothetical protein
MGSSVASTAVSAAMGVTAVAISTAISIAASVLPSAASPVSRPLLSLTVTSVITSVRETSSSVAIVVTCLLPDTSRKSRFSTRLYVNALNCVDSCARPPPAVQKVLGSSLRGQFDIQNLLPPSVFNCYRCCRLNGRILLRQDFLFGTRRKNVKLAINLLNCIPYNERARLAYMVTKIPQLEPSTTQIRSYLGARTVQVQGYYSRESRVPYPCPRL